MSDRTQHQDIRIGTMAGRGENTAEYIRQILPHGFECFQINFWQELPKGLTLKQMAKQVHRVLDEHADATGHRAVVSSLGMFGNPLQEASHAAGWRKCIDACEAFGCELVCGFAGALEDRPVPESIPKFKKVFGPLAKRAADKGVRLAFENCDMGGNWERPRFNIAHAPAGWELMFDAVPDENVGLEWEPCHQMNSLIDPIAQLREWIDKVFHVHGKDASVHWDVIRRHGLRGDQPITHHRTPGFGDTNWTDVISILRQHGYRGFIDIEGWHDPVYRGDLEMTGQVHSLKYLQHCRGGAYVKEPTA
ncbi:MAG: sugar phosphate isomerase/epimerase family protein [Planctomycetota bacterium]